MSIHAVRVAGRLTALAAALVATIAAAASGQGNPPMVPTVLATAVLGGFAGEMGTSPRFVVNREPAGWPDGLRPPAPWKVVGGLQFGPLLLAVFSGPRTGDASGGLAAMLVRAGLKPFVFPQMTGGFTGATAPAQMYCNDTTFISVVTVDSTASGRSIAVTRMGRGSAGGCSAQEHGSSPPIAIPSMRAPAGTTARRAGTGYGTDYVEATAQIDTTASVAAILDHYAGELRAAGWTVVGGPMADGEAGLQRVSVRDATRVEWQGTLTVVTAGGRRQLSLRVVRPATLD